MNPLSPRQQTILNRVVDTHIETALPVGSQSITALFHELYQDSYSPATVRHEMGLLEERGYLTHPHTSAGRIPTDLGYRYYVDHGLRHDKMSSELLDSANNLLEASEEDRSFPEKVTAAVSALSKEVCLILLSEPSGAKKQKRFKFFLQGNGSKPAFMPCFVCHHNTNKLYPSELFKFFLVQIFYGLFPP